MTNDTRISLILNLSHGTAIVETFDLGLVRLGVPCTDSLWKNRVAGNELLLLVLLQIQSVTWLSNIY